MLHRWIILLSAAFSHASLCLAINVPEVQSALDKNIIPILEDKCVDCHSGEVSKGDLNLETFLQPSSRRLDIRTWLKVREQLRAGTMPPVNKEPLPPAERDAVLQWIKHNEEALLTAPSGLPGSARSRRLNREEYSNTLHDLLGISSRPGDAFPSDGSGGEGFNNNADTLSISPLLIDKYMAAADAAINEVWNTPNLRQRLLATVTSDKLPADTGAELALRPFLPLAYRRPATDADVTLLLNVFRTAFKNSGNWDVAMKVMFKTALMSPKFLFLEESVPSNQSEPSPMNQYEVACRLSYFLWSSMPDAELTGLAAGNRLHDPAVIEAQVRRMLAHDKSLAFVKNFAGQWLRFEEVNNSLDPDRSRYPEFNDELRKAMYGEIFNFSDKMLRHNGMVLDFLDSNYTFLNEPLAKLYGIPGVQGKHFREVKFTDNKRGGVFGMAAVLATTSYPRRTSPVLRGKWILEQILGTPPPPPPPNVGQIPEDDHQLEGKTLRQRLEDHRSKPACAGCHVRLDPPGFALENFNPIGKWRDSENGKPLDTSAAMPGDRKFSTPAEFRQRIMEDKDLFVRTLTTKMLGYALGRGLEVDDQPELLRLEEILRKNGYHSEPLIIAIAQSRPFLWRR